MPQTVVDCFAVFAEWVSEFGAVERRLASSCNCTLILELCARQLRLKRSLWTWSVLWSGVSCCLLLLKYSYTVIGASTTLRMRWNFFFFFGFLLFNWELGNFNEIKVCAQLWLGVTMCFKKFYCEPKELSERVRCNILN